MLYRRYAPEDFEQLYAVEEVCFQPPFRFPRGYMRQLVRDPNAATWIAEDEGKILGFAIVEWGGEAREEAAYLQTIEVLTEARGQGVGAELLAQCEKSARTAGAGRIGLHVDEGNAAAIRMYQRHGYIFEERQENYYPRGRAALVGTKALCQDASPERHE